MDHSRPAHESRPPRWAESALRSFLKPRDQDTITGDLFEEYREVTLHELGELGAGLWYTRQALSLMWRSEMLKRTIAESLGWAVSAVLALAGRWSPCWL